MLVIQAEEITFKKIILLLRMNMLFIGDKQPLGIVCYILFLATLYLGGEYQGFKHMELVSDFLTFSFHRSLPTFMQTVCLLQVYQRKKN